MRKFLLILLSLILIIFSGCAPTDNGDVPQEPNTNIPPAQETPPSEGNNTPVNKELTDSDKEALRALLESGNLQELNKSGATGNIPVENAFMIREALPDGLSCDLEYDRERDIFISQRIIICDESELYPEGSEEYAYLFFNIPDDSSLINIREFNSANFEDSLLLVEITDEAEYPVAPDKKGSVKILPTVVILKILKEAVDTEKIETFEIIYNTTLFRKYVEGETPYLTKYEKLYIKYFLVNGPEENNTHSFINDTSSAEGNVRLIQTSTFNFMGGGHIYAQELLSGAVKNFVLLDEKDLFPESNEEYSYLVFFYEEQHDPLPYFKTQSINYENGTLNIELTKYDTALPHESLTHYMLVLKLDKSSIGGEIKNVNVDMSFDVAKNPNKTEVEIFVENYLNNTNTCNYSYVPNNIGNIEIGEIFLWSSVNTESLPPLLLEFDDNGQLKNPQIYDKNKYDENSSDEYLYWCFTYQGDTLIESVNCTYLHFSFEAMSINFDLYESAEGAKEQTTGLVVVKIKKSSLDEELRYSTVTVNTVANQ